MKDTDFDKATELKRQICCIEREEDQLQQLIDEFRPLWRSKEFFPQNLSLKGYHIGPDLTEVELEIPQKCWEPILSIIFEELMKQSQPLRREFKLL